MKSLPTVRNIHNVEGTRVLVRANLNVPITEGKIANDFRLREVLPTLTLLKKQGARIILISHLSAGGNASLRPVRDYLAEHFSVTFVQDCMSRKGKRALEQLQKGEVALIENIRQYPGEEKNDSDFAKKLADLGEVYINEDFAASHRKHASLVGIPQYLPSYIGLHFASEVKHLSQALNPPHPFTLILGGAKQETKIPLALKFLGLADHVFVGGSLATNFFAEKGYTVGRSPMSDTYFKLNKYFDHPRLVLPKDVVAETKDGQKVIREPDEVMKGDRMYDSGPKTMAMLEQLITSSRLVVWNGPLGVYEKGYVQTSHDLARMLANSSAKTIVGGGDTLATIWELDLENDFTFVSTAGGALLDFLHNGTLPAIEAIKESAH